MKVGRNDPCPCGSGRKSKHCCLALDRAAGQAGAGLGAEVRRAGAGAQGWQADVVPVPFVDEDDPAARPTALLVIADGVVVATEILRRVSPEVDELAGTLEGALQQAAELVGGWPPRVLVREAEVAAALEARLADALPGSSPLRVVSGDLDELDATAASLVEDLTGVSNWLRASNPLTWAAWGLPEELVEELFRAAAAFYRAAPWARLAGTEHLEVTGPGGRRWIAGVLGRGGETFGLNLFADRADHTQAIAGAVEDFAPRAPVLLLSFEPETGVNRQLRREVRRRGWEIAGPRAYPELVTLNTPAGGLRRCDAEDLVAILRAVPAFVAAALEDGGAAPAESWRHDATGCTLRLHSGAAVPSRGRLHPGGAEGPGADPEAAIAGLDAVREDPEGFVTRELEVVDRFAAHLEEAEGLAPSTARTHAGNAAAFVEHLAGSGVPVRAVHLRDLLDYLWDWYPRRSDDGATRRRALPVSLRRFFAYLGQQEGIVCPWAEAHLDDREGMERRWDEVPLGPLWDPEVILWRSEQYGALVDLLLVPDEGLGGSDSWGSTMGKEEFRLHQELERRWLLWRDELLRAGTTEREELLRRLVERQRAWERTPHPGLRGDSPRTAVWRERRDRKRERRAGRSSPRRR